MHETVCHYFGLNMKSMSLLSTLTKFPEEISYCKQEVHERILLYFLSDSVSRPPTSTCPGANPMKFGSTIYGGKGTVQALAIMEPKIDSRSSSRGGGDYDQEMGPPDAFFRSEGRHDHHQLPKIIDRRHCGISPKAVDSMRLAGAEFLGTFFMMFAVCGIIATTKMVEGAGLLEYAFAGGFAILVVIYAVGPISGAHVNPSITVAYAAIGELPWSKVPLYIPAQIAGAAFATFVGMAVYNMEADFANTRPLRGVAMAFFSELIASSLIMFLAASMSDNAQTIGQFAGFVVAGAIALAVMITAPVSGGSLNPVRSFGPAIVSWKFESLWLYFSAPTLGALAGALLYRLLKIQHTQLSCAATQSEAARCAVSGSVICETNLSTRRLTGN